MENDYSISFTDTKAENRQEEEGGPKSYGPLVAEPEHEPEFSCLLSEDSH